MTTVDTLRTMLPADHQAALMVVAELTNLLRAEVESRSPNPRKYANRVGSVFNDLTVIAVNEAEVACTYAATCKCKCGNIRVFSCGQVFGGHAKSCGCHKNKPPKKST